MDNTILKKKLSTFKSAKGNLLSVSPDVLFELLKAWEGWSGPSREFYHSIGINRRQAARILGKAKKMYREGGFPASEFSEVKIEGLTPQGAAPCNGIELSWEQGKVIRFPQVEQLIDFLKKVA